MERNFIIKYALVVLFLLFLYSISYAVPDNTMSVTPAASDGAVISAADENTRNNEVSTKFNAHTHEDFTKTTNDTFTVGDGAGNKTIYVDNDDSNFPYVQFNDTSNRFCFSTDGLTTAPILEIAWKTSEVVSLNLSSSGDVGYTDLDLTSTTSPYAKFALLGLQIYNTTSGEYAEMEVRKNGASVPYIKCSSPDEAYHTGNIYNTNFGIIEMDNGQIVEYKIDTESTSTVTAKITLLGYGY